MGSDLDQIISRIDTVNLNYHFQKKKWRGLQSFHFSFSYNKLLWTLSKHVYDSIFWINLYFTCINSRRHDSKYEIIYFN